ncbi:hypothetical protein NO2_0601 [Candidatus Termititenax persephonae]|uniref:Uncharacterized protein n=1 Tax=Candidatus Termititenax persephonae TaxID=2218525 RepID=A0A388TH33_9BACT|nr:hypothetical protein NO2_0601 [Candidatus Termititenax persephonae]
MQKSYVEQYALNPREFETIQNFGVTHPLQLASHRLYRWWAEFFDINVPKGYDEQPIKEFSQNSFKRFWQKMNSAFFGVDYQEPEER